MELLAFVKLNKIRKSCEVVQHFVAFLKMASVWKGQQSCEISMFGFDISLHQCCVDYRGQIGDVAIILFTQRF